MFKRRSDQDGTDNSSSKVHTGTTWEETNQQQIWGEN